MKGTKYTLKSLKYVNSLFSERTLLIGNWKKPVILPTPKFTTMGLPYADIEFINADDVAMARKSIIGQDEINRLYSLVLLDIGILNLCIHKSMQG